MATKRFCDHCTYDITDNRRYYKLEMKLAVPAGKTGSMSKVLDLCADCATAIRRAVEQPNIVKAA